MKSSLPFVIIVILFLCNLSDVLASDRFCSKVFTHSAIDRHELLSSLARLQIQIQFSENSERATYLEKFKQVSSEAVRLYGEGLFKGNEYLNILKQLLNLKIQQDAVNRTSKKNKDRKVEEQRPKAFKSIGNPELLFAEKSIKHMLFTNDFNKIIYTQFLHDPLNAISIYDISTKTTKKISIFDFSNTKQGNIENGKIQLFEFKNDPNKFAAIFGFKIDDKELFEIIVFNSDGLILKQIDLPKEMHLYNFSISNRIITLYDNFLVIGVRESLPGYSFTKKYVAIDADSGKIVNSLEGKVFTEFGSYLYDSWGSSIVNYDHSTSNLWMWDYRQNIKSSIADMAHFNIAKGFELLQDHSDIYYIFSGYPRRLVNINMTNTSSAIYEQPTIKEVKFDNAGANYIVKLTNSDQIEIEDNSRSTSQHFTIRNGQSLNLVDGNSYDSRVGLLLQTEKLLNATNRELRLYGNRGELLFTHILPPSTDVVRAFIHFENSSIVIETRHTLLSNSHEIIRIPILWEKLGDVHD